VGSTDPKNPVLPPIYADLSGLPPSLFLAGGRDYLLSGAANLHRAFMHAAWTHVSSSSMGCRTHSGTIHHFPSPSKPRT
jgi:acetyl esterase/lipase